MPLPINDPQFVQGQLDALRAIIYALAHQLPDPQAFLAAALQRIDGARDVIQGTPASEQWLAGLEDEEKWLRETF